MTFRQKSSIGLKHTLTACQSANWLDAYRRRNLLFPRTRRPGPLVNIQRRFTEGGPRIGTALVRPLLRSALARGWQRRSSGNLSTRIGMMSGLGGTSVADCTSSATLAPYRQKDLEFVARRDLVIRHGLEKIGQRRKSAAFGPGEKSPESFHASFLIPQRARVSLWPVVLPHS